MTRKKKLPYGYSYKKYANTSIYLDDIIALGLRQAIKKSISVTRRNEQKKLLIIKK